MRARLLPAHLLPVRLLLPVLLASLALPDPGLAQDHGIKLTAGDFGLGIGDVRRLDGLRLNFRDRDLELVRGINVTIWAPYEDAEGVVKGLALGLPMTGAGELHGVALGAGIAVEHGFSGIGFAPIGIGAGGTLRGIAIGGVGAGTGGDAEGLLVGGVGVGAGGNVKGIVFGGVGAGAGGNLEGIVVGGVGAGAGGDMTGFAFGTIGVGAGGNVRGIMVGGVGVGAGGDIDGIAIGGVGVGAGRELRGLGMAVVGVGAPKITGVVLSGIAAGAQDFRGLAVAPAYFKIEDGGSLRGVSVSAFNRIHGTQRGLTIGILNIADELHGLQVGVINIARNKNTFSVLPLANYCK